MADSWAWENKRWTVLASLAVLACLYMIMWYLTGGCEPSPEPTPGTGPGGREEPTLRNVQAVEDEAVVDFSCQVAWFYGQRDRLPKTGAEAHETAPADWPALPTATRSGRAITYRPTGEKQYDLVLAPPRGKPDAGPIVVPMTIPDTLPTQMTPEVFREWWKVEHLRQKMSEFQKHLEGMMRTPGGAD